MRIVLDITEMAIAMRLDPEEVLRQLNIDKPQGKLEEWDWVKPDPTPNLHTLDNFLGIASFFVKRE